MARQEIFNPNDTFQGTKFANEIRCFHGIFCTLFCFRKPFYAPCVRESCGKVLGSVGGCLVTSEGAGQRQKVLKGAGKH